MKQLPLSEALIVLETTSIYEARCQMAAQRVDVLILTNSDGLLTGILTNKVCLEFIITQSFTN